MYRRFRSRDQLVRAVVAHVLAAEIEPVADVETDDPWRDLAAIVEASVAAVAPHREVIALAHAAGGIDVDVVDRYLHRVDRVLSRARAAGLVRPELEPRDVAVAVVMVLATVHDGGREPGRGRLAPLPGAAAGRHAPRARSASGSDDCRPSAVMTTGIGSLTAPTKVSSGPRLRRPAPPTYARSRTSLPT